MMASITPRNDFALITIKINVEGSLRRIRLPLRDFAPSILIEKLRLILAIPSTSKATFERYSDSAAAFIVLDPTNITVFKQLYCAARVKQRIRMRVDIRPRLFPATEKKDSTILQNNQCYDPRFAYSYTMLSRNDLRNSTYSSPVHLADIQNGLKNLRLDDPQYDLNKNSARSAAISRDGNKKLKDSINHQRSLEMAVKASSSPNSKIDKHESVSTEEPNDEQMPSLQDSSQNVQIPEITENKIPTILKIPTNFNIFCNNCKASIPEEHYHCSNCDNGDYDLCLNCIAEGFHCHGEDHWLLKRVIRSGKIEYNRTERIAPKVQPLRRECLSSDKEPEVLIPTRTCNCCVQVFTEEHFVTCTTCPDYDLCITCHISMVHGHHPKHEFEPAVKGVSLTDQAQAFLAPGRAVKHDAICDGCSKSIYGIRHKCLDCPDWDYCSNCAATANISHPSHRALHDGIYCDGPLCKDSSSFISGDRYKCALCPDTDFCANCEASPSNVHNHTHPLIKFKSPVRDVRVTTIGEDKQGQDLSIMGDGRYLNENNSVEVCPRSKNAATQIQTVCDLTPSEATNFEHPKFGSTPCTKSDDTVLPHSQGLKHDMIFRGEIEHSLAKDPKFDIIHHAELERTTPNPKDFQEIPSNQVLMASFLRDEVNDDTIFTPDTEFEQKWYLRNDGNTAWPAKCYARHVSGCDLSLTKLVQSKNPRNSIISIGDPRCYDEVMPGNTAGFTVLMRTPSYPGNFVSYWCLTTPDGIDFGPRFWCDIRVEVSEPWVDDIERSIQKVDDSQMIFPTLQNEAVDTTPQPEPTVLVESEEDEIDGFVEEGLSDEDIDGFVTDDEYEILDASDEACGE